MKTCRRYFLFLTALLMSPRSVLATVMTLTLFMVVVGNAQAIPILGHADPGYASGYNPSTTTTGTATYSFFNVDDPLLNYNLFGLTLTFEGDVFNLNATSVNASSLPAGWGVSTLSGGVYELATVFDPFWFVPGAGIPEGGTLTFSVNYTLLGPAIGLPWDEGGAWEQGFAGALIAGSGNPLTSPPIIFTGGSTSAPEPGTLLLLGSGLAGLGFLRRKKLGQANA